MKVKNNVTFSCHEDWDRKIVSLQVLHTTARIGEVKESDVVTSEQVKIINESTFKKTFQSSKNFNQVEQN